MDRHNATTPHSSWHEHTETPIQPRHKEPARPNGRRNLVYRKDPHRTTDSSPDYVLHTGGRTRQTATKPDTNQIPTTPQGVQRRSRATLPRVAHLGSCNRTQTRSTVHPARKNLCAV